MSISDVLLGVFSSLLANSIQLSFDDDNESKFQEEVFQLFVEVEKDVCNKYPLLIEDDNLLNRESNKIKISNWLSEGARIDEIKLNNENFNNTIASEEQVEYIRKSFSKNIVKYDELRNRQIYNMVQEIYSEKNNGEVIYTKNQLNTKIIELCRVLDCELNKHVGIGLWCKEIQLQDGFLSSDNYEEAMNKFNKLLKLWNYSGFNDKSSKTSNNCFGALTYMLQTISSDYAAKLGDFYENEIKYVWDLLNEHDIKSNEYYLAIGALGLAKNYSDQTIYMCVLHKTNQFLLTTLDVVNEIFSSRNFERGNKEASKKMHDNINRKISIDSEDIQMIKLIFDRSSILDTELASSSSIAIETLRKRLFVYTSTFLNYRYHDNLTTQLSIKYYYRETFQNYYCEIFGGDYNETEVH